MVLAGCIGVGDGSTNDANETTREQVTEPDETTPETTVEPTDESTDESTDEPTAQPTDTPQTETEAAGNGDTESNNLGPTTLLAILAVFFLGLVAVGVLRGRNRSSTDESRQAHPAHPDSERVISLLHENNGRMFKDVLEKELRWSPAHTQRVLDGLVATGDVELEATADGTLVHSVAAT
ncbi:helix-turn-helix transcriptional regulator [Haloferax sp. DFSO60]|uniref:helix-turn-helix transcriptional regulator n=1 Tax=Haloferax sp. DFSO60 TaxID=3388652 RepID=UPI00397A9124